MSCSPRNNFLFAVATSSVLPMLQVCIKYMHGFKSVPFFFNRVFVNIIWKYSALS